MSENIQRFEAFDDIDKPSQEIINDCVHCGFCLSACPTYLATSNELDSPRGRIYLIKSALEGEIPMSEPFVKHLDLCLGCLACEPACPSGVKYGKLIETTKSQIERNYTRPFSETITKSIIFKIFPYSFRLKLLVPLLFLYQKSGLNRIFKKLGMLKLIPNKLVNMNDLMPEIDINKVFKVYKNFYPAKNNPKINVILLKGCVQSVFFPNTNFATINVLTKNGCNVLIPKKQGCCGALSVHSGRLEEGRNFARKLVDSFERYDADAIIVNSAGCGSTLKEYVDLLKDDPYYSEKAKLISEKTRDIMEFLDEIGIYEDFNNIHARVTYQDACHIAHAQGIKAAPRNLINKIPGIEFVEMQESDLCCGSAGIYNLVQTEMSENLLNRKIANLKETKTDMLISGNPGCLLQIEKGIKSNNLDIKTLHPVELLDRAYRRG